MRIRIGVLIALLCLPGAAQAASTDVTQQGAWALHTANSPAMTKDYFCASTGQFDRGYHLTVARNLLGQSSLVLTWPGLNATPGTPVAVRMNLEQKPLRDITAVAQSPDTLLAPLGWDDEAVDRLAAAPRVSIVIGTTTVRYELKNNSEALHRLRSCTASLIDRLPSDKGLSPELQTTLKKAGIADVRQVAVGKADAAKAENFMAADIFGGAETLPESSKASLADQMLDEMDQLEARCHARFSSDLGAPMPAQDGEVVTAEAKCSTLHAGSATILAFARHDDVTHLYYFEVDQNRADQARALRDKIIGALK